MFLLFFKSFWKTNRNIYSLDCICKIWQNLNDFFVAVTLKKCVKTLSWICHCTLYSVTFFFLLYHVLHQPMHFHLKCLWYFNVLYTIEPMLRNAVRCESAYLPKGSGSGTVSRTVWNRRIPQTHLINWSQHREMLFLLFKKKNLSMHVLARADIAKMVSLCFDCQQNNSGVAYRTI